MNLETNYLGLKLRNPLIVGASPYCDDTLVARQLERAGAAAIVMRSLFVEQIEAEQKALVHFAEMPAESNPEATSYMPAFADYQLGPDQYLRQISFLKGTLTIPVIASLNGCRPGGWTDYARRFEAAGADAVELNLYQLALDPKVSGEEVEADLLQTVHDVARAVKIPVAVKLSPFHTSPAHFAAALENAGAAGVVLFNRFYQPDFNIEDLEVQPQLRLSESNELLLRLRWLAAISPTFQGSLAATGGVHTATDVVKALLAGAHGVQLVSVILRHGPEILTRILGDLTIWLTVHGYEDMEQVRGAMNLSRCPDPSAFERSNYIRILQSWRV